jgi:hypothetical protein
LPWRVARRFEAEEIIEEGVFGADRFADAVGAHRPVVDAPRDPIIVWRRFSEVPLTFF